MDGNETPRLDEIQVALDAGEVDRVRRILLQVEGREKELLVKELGEDAFARARGAASRGRRRGKLGRVLVLPGIMGSELDSVDAKGDTDRIWLNYARLIFGRLRDLELRADGSPAVQGLQVRLAGVHRKTYLPMILELDTRWHVRPFPFDWRQDIDKSADRLAAEVRDFGSGEPLHLVAHSMGGLVSRRFIQRHRDVWDSMHDASGQGRGGRLVMLGTPNRGSFAIPLTLTGVEKLVKLLDRADLHHDREALLSIIGTFPGLYQMLPSPLVDLDDDHLRLFEAPTWGNGAVRAPLLTEAQRLIRDLHQVIDPERLLYIAGYDQRTPARIRVDRPGRFSYVETRDGDGRVPHALGLLDGVDTYWVHEIHGDLPKNGRVLDAITELLQRGTTTRLETSKPARAPATRAGRPRWVKDSEIEPVEPEIDTILAGAHSRGGKEDARLTPEEAVRLENLGFAQYLGTGAAEGDAVGPDGATPREVEPGVEAAPRTMRVEVVWGDVTRVDGDVYAVGHYEGVEPQRAELALDEAVSGVEPGEDVDARRLVITQHSRRGLLRGALGDVSFFPWGRGDGRGRFVAVAGMGRPGTFDRRALRQLASSLVLAIGGLPEARTVCSVLIGSGEGTLTVGEAVRGLVEGIGEAIDEVGAGEDLTLVAPVTELRIVERERGRAEEIHRAFVAVAREQRHAAGAGRRSPVEIDLSPRLKTGPGGTVSVEESIALLAHAALGASAASPESGERRALEELIARIPAPKKVRELSLAELDAAGRLLAEGSAARRFRVTLDRDTRSTRVPVRVSYWKDGPAIRVAAIHSAATVPERVIRVGGDIVDDLVQRMTDPRSDEVDDLCRLLYRLLVPSHFRDVLRSGPVVLEVDRSMAQVHWEMLSGAARGEGRQPPLSVVAPLARQLRTQYSPAPLPPRRPREKLRALVIGDPGDPAKGEDLPGARREALRVYELLRRKVEVVEARIGSPGGPRDGALRDVRPADRLDVLGLLLEGGFDILHYAGHGDFDPADPTRAGWLFAGGLLTGAEIERMEHVPSIVVANACLSARTSQALAGQRRTQDGASEAGLLPSLADEFFRLGVRDYVGTAWEVNDVGAELFAEVFYEAVLPGDSAPGESFGEAVRTGRQSLWDRRGDFGALWAAYQHYGDPTIHAGIARRVVGAA